MSWQQFGSDANFSSADINADSNKLEAISAVSTAKADTASKANADSAPTTRALPPKDTCAAPFPEGGPTSGGARYLQARSLMGPWADDTRLNDGCYDENPAPIVLSNGSVLMMHR
jgi:hypothetical protein